MKKVYRLQDLDCANCAAKMERAINKLPGVEEAVISFLTQRMTIVAEEENLPEILNQAQKAISKVEPNCKILGI